MFLLLGCMFWAAFSYGFWFGFVMLLPFLSQFGPELVMKLGGERWS